MALSSELKALQSNENEAFTYHEKYTVLDSGGNDIGVDLLIMYYGAPWRMALDRLHHQLNGYLFSIWHEGGEYAVYRRMVARDAKKPHLRLV